VISNQTGEFLEIRTSLFENWCWWSYPLYTKIFRGKKITSFQSYIWKLSWFLFILQCGVAGVIIFML